MGERPQGSKRASHARISRKAFLAEETTRAKALRWEPPGLAGEQIMGRKSERWEG